MRSPSPSTHRALALLALALGASASNGGRAGCARELAPPAAREALDSREEARAQQLAQQLTQRLRTAFAAGGAGFETTDGLALGLAAGAGSAGAITEAQLGAALTRLLASQGAGGLFDERRRTSWRALGALRRLPGRAPREALERCERALRADTPATIETAGNAAERAALAFLQAGRGSARAYDELEAFAGRELEAGALQRALVGDALAGDALGRALGLEPEGEEPTLLTLCLGVRLCARFPSASRLSPAGERWPARALRLLEQSTAGELRARDAALGLLTLEALTPWLSLELPTLVPQEQGYADHSRRLRDDCESCHQHLNPGLHAQWSESAHAREGVGCDACHGLNHSLTFREGGRVAPSICAGCHEREAAEFALSRHARAQATLEASALFRDTPLALRAACQGCHRIGVAQANGESGSCNYCHTGHAFSAREAREPGACSGCHVGEDYPQAEAYASSKHGILWAQTGDARVAPTCSSCHQPAGRHDDGYGLTLGASGAGAALVGEPQPIPMRTLTSEQVSLGRARMVALCEQCHSSRFSRASLSEADAIKREGQAYLSQAAQLLTELHAEGRLGSAPLVLGGEQLRPALDQPGAALLERFYTMWRFHFAGSWKGAYHNSFSVTNNHSLPGLARDLEWLEAEAEKLRADE